MDNLLSILGSFIVEHWKVLDALLAITGLIIYVAASHSLNQRRQPSAAIAWVLSILLVPWLALPLYLAFGSRKVAYPFPLSRRVSAHVSVTTSSPTIVRSLQLGEAMGLSDPSSYEGLNIHEDGTQALSALRHLIVNASSSLEISTFLLGRDVLGNEIVEMLKQRARVGVKVRLLIDGIGIYLGGYPDLKELERSGVSVVRFVPPFKSPRRGRTNLRNHRKMVIADGETLWCGGRNLSAEYFEGDSDSIFKRKSWVDLSFDLRGELVTQVRQQFEVDWAFATSNERPKVCQVSAEEADDRKSLSALAQLIDSGPDRPDDTIFTLLVSACFTSQKRILAMTPYFVPDSSLLTAMTLAARRGIQVDLVLPGKSNHRLADFVRHRALRDLVASGGRVWLHPRMVHAKAVLIDDDLALAGSANLDGRSLFINYEMMIAFYDQNAVLAFSQWVEARRQECRGYTSQRPGMLREFAEGLLLWLAFQL